MMTGRKKAEECSTCGGTPCMGEKLCPNCSKRKRGWRTQGCMTLCASCDQKVT